jgi:hypothetical protein
VSPLGDRAQGWPAEDELLPLGKGEQVGQIGLAAGELLDSGQTRRQTSFALDPALQSEQVQALIRSHFDDVIHRSEAIGELGHNIGLASIATMRGSIDTL